MIVYLRLYYILAFCIYRFFNLPRILFSPIPVKQNHPREMHHNRCTLRVRPIAKNNGRGIRYRYNLSYGERSTRFSLSERNGDGRLHREVRRRLRESAFCAAVAKRNARTIYTETLRQARNSSENTQRRKTGKRMGDDYSW